MSMIAYKWQEMHASGNICSLECYRPTDVVVYYSCCCVLKSNGFRVISVCYELVSWIKHTSN